MSRRIFKDVEEALAREVRRITFHDERTVEETVLEENFDPFTGEIVSLPIEPSFYDSSADVGHIQYPHFFIRLLKTREDRYTSRVVPPYGKWCKTPLTTAPGAYELIVTGIDGTIASPGATITTTVFQINKIQPGYLIRLIDGNNIGTYIVATVVPSASGPHTITVSNTLAKDLSSALFDSINRVLVFENPIDLNTIAIGDTFEDASASTFSIDSIDIESNSIELGGVATPDINTGGKFIRIGNVFKFTDPSLVRFRVMDPDSPIQATGVNGTQDATSKVVSVDPGIPIDSYYLIRIDSKDRDSHVEVINRVWEEFNPPRSALPVVVRSALSADQKLIEDIASGGSTTIKVTDNSKFNLNDPIYIIDNISPTKNKEGLLLEPFSSKVVSKSGTDTLVLEDTVPDSFTVSNNAEIVSNAIFRTYMFNFVDHITRDIEGAQYWVHEFQFWVQIWVDKLGTPTETDTVQDISTPIEDLDGKIIFEDPS